MENNFDLEYYDSVIERLTEKIENHKQYVMDCKENGIFVSYTAELKFINKHLSYLINQSKKEENLTNGIYQMWVSREINSMIFRKRKILKSLRKLHIKWESHKEKMSWDTIVENLTIS